MTLTNMSAQQKGLQLQPFFTTLSLAAQGLIAAAQYRFQ